VTDFPGLPKLGPGGGGSDQNVLLVRTWFFFWFPHSFAPLSAAGRSAPPAFDSGREKRTSRLFCAADGRRKWPWSPSLAQEAGARRGGSETKSRLTTLIDEYGDREKLERLEKDTHDVHHAYAWHLLNDEKSQEREEDDAEGFASGEYMDPEAVASFVEERRRSRMRDYHCEGEGD
jgi:hypothetical protein